MPGTKAGGQKQRETMLKRYGLNEEGKMNFFIQIGGLGGRKGRTGGFYANRELASIAGRKGGLISRRRKKDEPK